jgi:hypothetical protein
MSIYDPDVDYDKWDELRKYLLSCKGNNIFIHEVLRIMDDIDNEEIRLRQKYWDDYQKSKVIIHCSKCTCRMELVPDPYNKEEIICPLMGCNQPTGMKGYSMVSAGGRDND